MSAQCANMNTGFANPAASQTSSSGPMAGAEGDGGNVGQNGAVLPGAAPAMAPATENLDLAVRLMQMAQLFLGIAQQSLQGSAAVETNEQNSDDGPQPTQTNSAMPSLDQLLADLSMILNGTSNNFMGGSALDDAANTNDPDMPYEVVEPMCGPAEAPPSFSQPAPAPSETNPVDSFDVNTDFDPNLDTDGAAFISLNTVDFETAVTDFDNLFDFGRPAEQTNSG